MSRVRERERESELRTIIIITWHVQSKHLRLLCRSSTAPPRALTHSLNSHSVCGNILYSQNNVQSLSIKSISFSLLFARSRASAHTHTYFFNNASDNFSYSLRHPSLYITYNFVQYQPIHMVCRMCCYFSLFSRVFISRLCPWGANIV